MCTHKAGAVFTERGLDVGVLSERVDEAHLAVKQRAGFHEVVDHLVPADLPIPVRGSEQTGEGWEGFGLTDWGELAPSCWVGELEAWTVHKSEKTLTGSCPVLQTCWGKGSCSWWLRILPGRCCRRRPCRSSWRRTVSEKVLRVKLQCLLGYKVFTDNSSSLWIYPLKEWEPGITFLTRLLRAKV